MGSPVSFNNEQGSQTNLSRPQMDFRTDPKGRPQVAFDLEDSLSGVTDMSYLELNASATPPVTPPVTPPATPPVTPP